MDGKDDIPNRTLVNPGSTIEDMRKAALAMHRAIHGREPTIAELEDQDKLVAEYKTERH